MRGHGKILWAAYFDSTRTRKEGRHVPLKLAVPSPTIEEVAEAVELLGYPAEVHSEKRFPASWWASSGYVRVDVDIPKSRLIVEVAKKLVEVRKMKSSKTA